MLFKAMKSLTVTTPSPSQSPTTAGTSGTAAGWTGASPDLPDGAPGSKPPGVLVAVAVGVAVEVGVEVEVGVAVGWTHPTSLAVKSSNVAVTGRLVVALLTEKKAASGALTCRAAVPSVVVTVHTTGSEVPSCHTFILRLVGLVP